MKIEFHLDHEYQPENTRNLRTITLLVKLRLTLIRSPLEFSDFFDKTRVVFLICEDELSTFNATRLCLPIDSGNKQYHLNFIEF